MCIKKLPYLSNKEGATVKYNLNKRQGSFSAQLRTGTLSLALETYRFNATPGEWKIFSVNIFNFVKKLNEMFDQLN